MVDQHGSVPDVQLLLRDVDELRRENKRLLAELDRRPDELTVRSLAAQEAVKVMTSVGFDMEHLGDTASRVTWVLELKPGFRTGVMTIIGGVVAVTVGLLIAWLGPLVGARR